MLSAHVVCEEATSLPNLAFLFWANQRAVIVVGRLVW